ncbi:MAG: RNA polymerase sigma factor [Myxococcota bacterium]
MQAGTPEQLLSAAQAGDQQALESLLALHRNGVYRYGMRVCRTTEDAEDAVQETLWAATRALKTFRGTAGSIAGWLFTIVRHRCYRMLDRWRRAEEAADLPTPFQSPLEDTVAAREQSRLLAEALARMDPRDRQVILLRDVEGLTAPEAAAALGISVGALKSRLHRARVTLREALQGEAG